MNDATVTCLSPTLEDRNVAEGIATFLERHDKKVVCRDALQGTLAELDTAQWNIFVMSQDSFNREFIGIELISSIERCAQNKCIQILPVITGMRMEEVPDSLKWVTMISTEQDNYKQIILYQIEGRLEYLLILCILSICCMSPQNLKVIECLVLGQPKLKYYIFLLKLLQKIILLNMFCSKQLGSST